MFTVVMTVMPASRSSWRSCQRLALRDPGTLVWAISSTRATWGLRARTASRSISGNGVKTKRECQAALNDALAGLRAGTVVWPPKRTLERFLVDEWLPALRHLRPSTLSNYRTHIRTCVLPTLGPIPPQQLSPAPLNAFYEGLLSRGRLRDGHGMAPKTVQNVHAILHRALQDAMRWGYVPRNVADAVDPPKGLPAERQVWTPQQLPAVLPHRRAGVPLTPGSAFGT